MAESAARAATSRAGGYGGGSGGNEGRTRPVSVYLDASVIVPLFVQEKTSEAMLAWMASVDRAIVSDWAIAEVSSAMSHHVRRGSLDVDERDLAETKFNIWLDRAAAVS